MSRKRSGLKAKDRDTLVQTLLRKYETEPTVVEKALPEIAELLRVLTRRSENTGRWEIFKVTSREEEECWRSYLKLVEKMNDGKQDFSCEEAIKALEDAAALREGSFQASLELDPKDLMKLVKVASVSLSKTEKAKELVLREGISAMTVSLIRGVQLHLTWDRKLLSIEVDPKQLRLRGRALEFIGTGNDEAKNVAARHDDYLAGEIANV